AIKCSTVRQVISADSRLNSIDNKANKCVPLSNFMLPYGKYGKYKYSRMVPLNSANGHNMTYVKQLFDCIVPTLVEALHKVDLN
ncbi:hypothetical protein MTR67_012757, partial [Solanum verrucosum]